MSECCPRRWSRFVLLTVGDGWRVMGLRMKGTKFEAGARLVAALLTELLNTKLVAFRIAHHRQIAAVAQDGGAERDQAGHLRFDGSVGA